MRDEKKMHAELVKNLGWDIFRSALHRPDEVLRDIGRHDEVGTVNAIIDLAVKANPTPHVGYSHWLLDRWVGQKITLGQMRDSTPVIKRFVDTVKQIPQDQWNIFQYLTVADMSTMLNTHLGPEKKVSKGMSLSIG